jgi:hypothetical protein
MRRHVSEVNLSERRERERCYFGLVMEKDKRGK